MCNFRFFCYTYKRTTTHTIHINVETNILLPHNSAQFILRRNIKRMLCIRTHIEREREREKKVQAKISTDRKRKRN